MRTRAQILAGQRRSWRKRADRFIWSLGLRTDGKPRLGKRTKRYGHHKIRHERERQLAKYHARAARFTAAGLTTRGTPRKVGMRSTASHILSPLQQLHRELHANLPPILHIDDVYYNERRNYG